MSKKLSICNDALQPVQQPLEAIENLILNIRGKQVMLDRDLARLYGVETKVLNDYITLNVPFVAVSNVPLQTWSF